MSEPEIAARMRATNPEARVPMSVPSQIRCDSAMVVSNGFPITLLEIRCLGTGNSLIRQRPHSADG